ncbi:hypothetical protein AB1Y20_001811 [Prymnesium parvum]|uniref:Lon N-terminal domain-containing protein n=1 Tax=Prymnesium parvum TaxID=97485 RepID=A0AB34KEL4_PRYPA
MLAVSSAIAAAVVLHPSPVGHSAPLSPRLVFSSRRAGECARMQLGDRVTWFPPIDISRPEEPPSDGATVMPLFPLGATYLPYTNPVLNIFEPRYRKMFNDILFSGARRFMVTNVDQDTGRMAEVGVVFYLDELKEVSEQTQDRVKYIGQHSVIGRVRLLKVLNPDASATRETYLRAEVAPLEDRDDEDSETVAAAEAATQKLFLDIVDTQASLGEEPRFTQAVKNGLSFSKGSGPEDKGLWGTIVLWQQFLESRTQVMGQKMQREIQKGVVEFLKDNKIQEDLVSPRGEIRLEDLPAPLLQEHCRGRSLNQ